MKKKKKEIQKSNTSETEVEGESRGESKS